MYMVRIYGLLIFIVVHMNTSYFNLNNKKVK